MTEVLFSDRTGLLYRHYLATHLVTGRFIDVWCPPGYRADQQTRYPVIYMHDGQNLFDPALSYTGIDWGVDEAIHLLIGTYAISGAIVVGIWNTALRQREYMPAKSLTMPEHGHVLQQFCEQANGAPLSDQYLAFVTQELKPWIDQQPITNRPGVLVWIGNWRCFWLNSNFEYNCWHPTTNTIVRSALLCR